MCLMSTHYSHMQQYVSSKLRIWAFDIGQIIKHTISLDETTYDFNFIDYKWQKFSIMHMTNNNKMDLTNLQNSNSNRVMIDPPKKEVINT
jgi:hypothetical protein